MAAGDRALDELRAVAHVGAATRRATSPTIWPIIAAQVAANQQGARDLARLVERYTLPVVESYMRHIQEAAERKMRQALPRLTPGRYEFVDHLDDGTPIAVAITIDGDKAAASTSPAPAGVLPGNLNANRAIVTAAVMYCLRLLLAEDIPLNQGRAGAGADHAARGLLNPPERRTPADCPAMVGGNVETSQRVVDVLLGALGSPPPARGR